MQTFWVRFHQQRLPRQKWPFICFQMKVVASLFLICCLLFNSIGIILLMYAKLAYRSSVAYYTMSDSSIILNIQENLKKPVFLYYDLDNFHGNTKRFITSRPKEYYGPTYDCGNAKTFGAMRRIFNNATLFSEFDDSDELMPCGLSSLSYFNDEFEVFKPNGDKILLNHEGMFTVSWKEDEAIFRHDSPLCDEIRSNSVLCSTPQAKAVSIRSDSILKYCKYWTCPATNKRFQAWLRTDPTKKVHDLWAVIDEDLEKGNYTVHITKNR
eukprot:GHVL01039441.1.p1 GENE.GHVL01039441.1~~GHVL01039441.1.p1  ORF type:complete len:268 (+),score=16.78 GHVL01039441.1:119-922(+)